MEKTRLEAKVIPLRYLPGIGPKRSHALEKLGIRSLHDLFFLFPRRYEDRTHFLKIEEIGPTENVTFRGEILTLGIRPVKQMPIFEMVVGDDTGMISAVWFNQPYLKNQFRVGMKVILSGRVDLYQEKLQVISPEYEVIEGEEENPIHMGRITPIYPLTEGLYQRSTRAIMKGILDKFLDPEIQESLPPEWLQSLKLMPISEAICEMHFPSDYEKLEQARQRISFDEFFLFELELLIRLRGQREKQNTHPLGGGAVFAELFKKTLPFILTKDQEKAILEIAKDCAQTYPMNRLLQGEVGSGKTLVAAFAVALAYREKKQSALLVPTELLAEQHARTMERFLSPLGISVKLLTSSTPYEKREKILATLRKGEPLVLIGTHALLQEDVQFQALALVVIDEQHKFGVRQRGQLLHADPRPHQLIMTATPIPRTLALTLYGDLDVSTITKLPQGRKPVKTYWITREKQPEVLRHIREGVCQGDQAYLVFPTIDETERVDLFSAKEEYERLTCQEFKGLKVGLVHGRLEREERELIMRDFRERRIQILVATSVIEVGIDNPNASIMVIENAERFGLSQLHQLRGRVGRGEKEAECYLFGEPKTDEGKRRLRILTKTQDGFVIAEEDLRLRGPGELLGTRQSGEPFFRVADLRRDASLLSLARKTALEILREDPCLSSSQMERLNTELMHWNS